MSSSSTRCSLSQCYASLIGSEQGQLFSVFMVLVLLLIVKFLHWTINSMSTGTRTVLISSLYPKSLAWPLGFRKCAINIYWLNIWMMPFCIPKGPVHCRYSVYLFIDRLIEWFHTIIQSLMRSIRPTVVSLFSDWGSLGEANYLARVTEQGRKHYDKNPDLLSSCLNHSTMLLQSKLLGSFVHLETLRRSSWKEPKSQL